MMVCRRRSLFLLVCALHACALALGAGHQDRVIDITLPLRSAKTVYWERPAGKCIKGFTTLLQGDMEKGDPSYVTGLSFPVHAGTHIDLPSTMVQKEMAAGNTLERVDLTRLIGAARVVEVPAGSNITADVLEDLGIDERLERLIFKTDSTKRRLIHEPYFESDYTALTASGARFLATKTSVKVVGIDYLGVGAYDDDVKVHLTLFKKGILVVEGLVLDEVEPGEYTMACLPLKLQGAEGGPVRCILTPPAAAERADAKDEL